MAALATVVLCLMGPSPALAQTPVVVPGGLATDPLIGEQVCTTASFTNADPVEGFGPYVFVVIPPYISVTANTFLGLAPPIESVGTVDASGMIADPISGTVLPGEPGGTANIIRYPVGSVVQGQPPLVLDLCGIANIGAEIGVPLTFNFLPGFEFGDTPTGDNGPITGPGGQTANLTPQLARVEKTADVPEGERPPGPSNAFTYTYVVNISAGAPLTDLVLADDLPPEIQWTGAPPSIAGAACGVTNEPNLAPTSGGLFEVTCPVVIGTASTTDLTVSLPVYITDILDETNGNDTQLIVNQVDVSYNFQGAPYDNSDTAEVLAKHVAVQKVASPLVIVPGDTVSFGIHFQVTDYTDGNEELTDLVVEDVLGDGLEYVGNESLVVNTAPTPLAPPTVTAGPGLGETTLVFDIGTATGGSFPLASNANLSYDALVLENYADGGTVVASDPLGNTVDTDFSHSEGGTGNDGSSSFVTVEPTVPSKTLVAPVPLPDPLAPGDTVTFRLELEIPSDDTLAIAITDFMPLPVVYVADIDPNTDITVPNLPGITDVAPVYSADIPGNAFTLTWPDPAGLGFERVAADITVTITDVPFADGLFLTNLMQASSLNSEGDVNTQLIARGFNVGAPDVFITKGILSVGNPRASVNPPAPADPAQALADSDASGADAGDLVTYLLTVENRGSQGAFNLFIQDPPVPGLNCQSLAPADVTDATGSQVGFIGTNLQAGIKVIGPLPGNDQVPPGGGAPFAADTLLIRQRCTVDAGVVAGETLTNTATVQFTSTSGSNTNFPVRSDSAELTLASPTVDKTITAITPGYAGDLRSAHIGEMVSYQVVITVPEGSSPQVQLDDVLNPGLAFVALDSIVASPGLSTSVGSFDPGVIANAGIGPQGGGDTNLDRRLLIGPTDTDFGFGDVVNANTDNGVQETITLNYTARVLNAPGNVRGTNLHNRALWTWATAGGRGQVQDNAPNVTVIEPTIDITKQFDPTSADSGNPATVKIRVRHAGSSNAEAFEFALVDAFPLGVTPDGTTLTFENCNLPPSGYNLTIPQLNAVWNNFPVGSDCTLVFDTTGQPAIPAGTVLTNCAVGRWSSMDDSDPVLPNPPTNPLGVERTGDTTDPGGAANTYEDESCADLKIFDVGIAKTIIASSQADTVAEGGVEELTIGEEVTFLLSATLPEGNTTNLTIEDTLPTGGALLEVLSATVRQPYGNRLTVPGGVPVPALADQSLGDGLDDFMAADFPVVIFNDPDSQVDEGDRIEIEVVARVKNLPVNQNGAQDDNIGTVLFNQGLSGTDTAAIRIVEPLLSLTKTADTGSVEAGDVITYTLRVAHQGGSGAVAYDVALSDTLPAELQLVPGSAVVGANCTAAPTTGPSEAGNAINAFWTALPLGANCEIEFQATVSVAAVSGTEIINPAMVSWTSLDAFTPTNEDERSYSDDSEWPVTVGDPGLEKVLTGSDIPQTENEQVTIGETVTFEITATFPDGTTEAVSVADVLPPLNGAVELLSSSIVAIGADLTITNAPSTGDPGTDCQPDCSYGDQGFDDTAMWILGDVVNAPNASPDSVGPADQVVFQVVGIVKNLPINQGIPAGVDFLFNTAALDSANLQMGDQAPITLVEPRLALNQWIDGNQELDVRGADELVNVSLVISHLPDSSAPAFSVELTDALAEFVLWEDDSTVSSDCPGWTVDSSLAQAPPAVVSFSFDELPLDQGSCTIEYQVRTAPNLPVPGVSINQSTLDWESAPGSAESRSGSDTDFITLLSTVDGEVFKRLVNTSVLATNEEQGDPLLIDLTIGEVVTYELVAGFTEGTTSNVTLSDTLPAGLAIEGASVYALGANISTSLPGAPNIAGDTVTFDFGEVTNNADNVVNLDDAIVVRITARVLDIPANSGGDQLTNAALFEFGPANGIISRTAEATVDVVEPVLALTKAFGDVLDSRVPITLTVTNNGTGPAFSTLVTDDFDETIFVAGSMQPETVPTGWAVEASSSAGVTTVSFGPENDPDLPSANQVILPGGSRTVVFSLELVVPPAVPEVDNTAEASALSLRAQDPAARETTAQAMDSLPLPILDTTKAWSGPNNPAVPGDLVTYTVEVTNTGNGEATQVTVTDQPDPLGEFQAGSVTITAGTGTVVTGNLAGDTSVEVLFPAVPGNSTASFTYQVAVPLPYPALVAMEFVNQALTASIELPDFDSDDPDTADPDDPTIVPIEAAPEMSIVKDDVSDVVAAGGTIVYALDYGNIGNQDAVDVVITDAVPDNTTFNAGASTPGWSCADGDPPSTVCTLLIGDLGAGQGGTVNFSVTVDNPLPPGVDEVFNQAFIEDSTGSTDDDDDDTPVAAVPLLDITKDDGGISSVPGGVVVYQIDYGNTGTQDATGVSLAELVPANSTFNAAASAPSVWSCADGSPAGTSCTLQIGDLDAGDQGTAGFAVTVVAPLPAGVEQIQNGVSIRDDGSNSQGIPIFAVAFDITPVIAQPDLVIDKDDNDIIGRPGLVIPYTLTWQQVGNQDATGVAITETVPVGATYAAIGSLPNVWSCADGDPAGTVCTLALGDVPAGAAGTARFGIRVDDPIPPGQSEVVNTVVIADDGANGPDPTPANNTDTVATLVIMFRPAGHKTATQVDGRYIEWRMVWFNNLNTTDLLVSIQDPIPLHQTYEPGTAVCTPTGTSQCTSITFNSAMNRIEAEAVIAPDFGAPDSAGEADLDNEIVITFRTRIDQPGATTNIADACWDEFNTGSADDDRANGQDCVDIQANIRGYVPIPSLGALAMVTLVLLLAGMGMRRMRRQAG